MIPPLKSSSLVPVSDSSPYWHLLIVFLWFLLWWVTFYCILETLDPTYIDFGMPSPCLGLAHRFWSAFVGFNYSDTLVFWAFAMLFWSNLFFWCKTPAQSSLVPPAGAEGMSPVHLFSLCDLLGVEDKPLGLVVPLLERQGDAALVPCCGTGSGRSWDFADAALGRSDGPLWHRLRSRDCEGLRLCCSSCCRQMRLHWGPALQWGLEQPRASTGGWACLQGPPWWSSLGLLISTLFDFSFPCPLATESKIFCGFLIFRYLCSLVVPGCKSFWSPLLGYMWNEKKTQGTHHVVIPKSWGPYPSTFFYPTFNYFSIVCWMISSAFRGQTKEKWVYTIWFWNQTSLHMFYVEKFQKWKKQKWKNFVKVG